MVADYSRGLLLFITYYDNSIVPVPSATFYDERIGRVLPRVLLCKTWRCGLTCDGRAVSTSRGGALSASRAPLKALPPVPSPFPSSRLLSRVLFLYPSPFRRGLHPTYCTLLQKRRFSGFFDDPVYINGIGGKRPCCEVASSDTRNRIVYRTAINLGARGFLRAL